VRYWTENDTTATCDASTHVYCFETGHDSPIADAAPRGRLAFLSDDVFAITTGIDAADVFCAGEATAAGITTGTFKALLATTGQPANARFDRTKGSWFRRDGTLVSRDLTALTAPIDRTAKGQYLAAEVFFGAASLTELATASCVDWSSTAATTSTGESGRTHASAFSGQATHTCGTPQHVYCLEQ